MHLFHRRPLCFACFLFLAASIAGFFVTAAVKFILAAVCAAVAAGFIVRAAVVRRRGYLPRRAVVRSVTAVVFSLSAIAGLAVSYSHFDRKYMGLYKYTGREVEIEAVVTAMTYNVVYAANYDIELISIDGERVGTKLKLRCEYGSALIPGDRFRAVVTLRELRDEVNGFAEKRYYLSQGFTFAAISSDRDAYEITADQSRSPAVSAAIALDGINRAMWGMIESAAGRGDESSLVGVLLLGRRNVLSDGVRRDVRRTGMSHMIAISGFHMAMLAAGGDYLLRIFPLGRKPRRAVLIAVLLAYAAASGFLVSAIRAALMLSMAYGAEFFRGRADAPTSLFAAGVLICLINPGAVIDAGLWLSFCSTLGIILSAGHIRRISARIKPKGVDSSAGRIIIKAAFTVMRFFVINALVTSAAVISTLPLMWLYFGEISLVSLPCNLLLTPLITLVLYISPMILIFSGIPALCVPLSAAAVFLCRIILTVWAAVSRLPGIMISLKYAFAPYIIGGLAVYLLILAAAPLERIPLERIPVIRKLRASLTRGVIAVIPPVAAAAVFAVCVTAGRLSSAGELGVVYINNKKNDCIVLIYEGKAAVCDFSDGSYATAAAALDAISEAAVCEVEDFIFTHYHLRHISALRRLLASAVIRRVWLPEPQNETERYIFLDLLDEVIAAGSEAVIIGGGNTAYGVAGGVTVELSRGYIKRSTHPVLYLSAAAPGRPAATYIGTSLHESGLYADAAGAAENSGAVIFGTHGPVTKSDYEYPLSDRLKLAMFANADVLDAYKRGGIFPAGAGIFVNIERRRFLLE